MPRISVQLHFPLELWSKVEAAAQRRGVRPGTLLREAVEAYLGKPWRPDEQARVEQGSPYRLARVQLMPEDWEKIQKLAKKWELSGSDLIRAAVAKWLSAGAEGIHQ